MFCSLLARQVRVSRFYQELLPSPPLPPPRPASSRSQWALPDLNRELQISVGTAGPQPPSDLSAGHQLRAADLSGRSRNSTTHQPRAPDLSGHCLTSTASSRFQWDLNLSGSALWPSEIWRSRLGSGSAHVRENVRIYAR